MRLRNLGQKEDRQYCEREHVECQARQPGLVGKISHKHLAKFPFSS